MVKVEVCIGSSCHLKGSRQIVEKLQELVDKNGLADKVDLKGAFCMGRCRDGVSVSIDDNEIFSVTEETAEEFFEKEVKTRI